MSLTKVEILARSEDKKSFAFKCVIDDRDLLYLPLSHDQVSIDSIALLDLITQKVGTRLILDYKDIDMLQILDGFLEVGKIERDPFEPCAVIYAELTLGDPPARLELPKPIRRVPRWKLP